MSDDPYLPVLRLIYAKHLESRASILALRMLIAESLAEKEGLELSAALQRVEVLEKKMHAQLLLEAEVIDPGLTVLLDSRSLDDAAQAEEDDER